MAGYGAQGHHQVAKTAQQREVLDFMQRRLNATGHLPRVSEIRRHMRWKNCNTATQTLHRLEKHGHLKIERVSEDGRVLAWSLVQREATA